MSTILFITTSPRGEASLSTQVAQTLVDDLTAGDPNSTVVTRDLGNAPLPHIGQDLIGGFFAPADQLTPAQRTALAVSDELIAELMAADTVVIASAMINFSITSTLKAWIDHLARAKITFQYSEAGVPVGLVTGKKIYVVLSTGAVYSAAPMDAIDFQTPYLKHMLGFMGMTEVEVIRVEGSIFGPEAAEKAVTAATAQARTVAQQAIAA